MVLKFCAEEVFLKAKVVVGSFHVIADSSRKMDEVRRIERGVLWKKRVGIPVNGFIQSYK